VDLTRLAGRGCVLALADAVEQDAVRGLTTAEWRECVSLASPSCRANYRAGRLAAKRAVARLARPSADTGVDALATLRWVAARRRPGAAPVVRSRGSDGRWRRLPVAVSLAHRDGLAAAVAAPGGARIGVDVERAGAIAGSHVRWFAHPAERERGPRDAAALWALKEAAWKALALGESLPLRALALEFDDAGELVAATVGGRRVEARGAVLRPWPEHVVAVVRAGRS